jgi:hypothetical protein
LTTFGNAWGFFGAGFLHDAGHQAALAAAGIRGSVGPRQTTFAPMPTVPGSDLYPVKDAPGRFTR